MSKKNSRSINSVGLDVQKSEKLVVGLNRLLATYQVHYQNLRGCHWNITGPTFFDLHAKFEELYTKAQTFIDEIAERVLTLEGRPLHTFSAYLKNSAVKEKPDLRGAKDTVAAVMEDMSALIRIHREVVSVADETGDDATSTLIGDNIVVLEKDLWMLRAYSGS